jgi:hypothetical protein
LKVAPAKTRWTHFIERQQRALYFANGSLTTIGKSRAASVRLHERGGTQLPDGQHRSLAGGEGVSQSPLKDKAFSTFLDQNPPFELPPENGISPSTKACPAQWPVIDNSAIIAVAPLSLIAVQSQNLMVAHPVLAQPFNFRRRSTS